LAAGRNAAALHGVADRKEEVARIAGKGIGAAPVDAVPEGRAGILRCIDGRAAMAVGAGIAAVMVGIAEKAEAYATVEAMAGGRLAVARAHGVQERPVHDRCLGTAVHGDDLHDRGQVFDDRVPVHAARAKAVADMVRKGENAVAIGGAQLGMQLGRRIGLDDLLAGDVAIDDRVVAMGEGMDFVTWKDGEGAGFVGCRQCIEMGIPQLFELGETLDVEIDDMGDTRVVDRHVGPVGVPRDGDEIQLAAGAAQSLLEAAVAIGNVAVIVDVAIERPDAKARGKWL
jgi:hypothetical protein